MPSIVALPNPEPQPTPAPIVARENPEPPRKAAAPVPNPALRRASAPPPRISEPTIRKIALPPSLKPKVRWNNRAPAIDPASKANNGNGNGAEYVAQKPLMPPAQNVIQMKPALPRPPRVIPRPENLVPQKPAPIMPRAKPAPAARTGQPIPAPIVRENPRPQVSAKVEMPAVRANPRSPVASNPQADFFEMFAQSGETAISKRRRKSKMRRFIIFESIVVGMLLPLAILGFAHHSTNVALVWTMNILTIASAVAAAVIPILFFALTPTLPEIER